MSEPPAAALPLPAPGGARTLVPVRWKIFAFMFGFGVFAYVQQKGLSVAALRMMPELGLTQQQIGWLQTAFIAGYTLMQFPGGLLGQRFRPRLVFAALGFGACAAALIVPLAPLVLVGAPLLVTLLLGRALLGALQAPVFPVTNGIFEAWFPPRQWPLVQGLSAACLGVGLAVTAPLVAHLMEASNWQRALLWTNVPMFVLALLWVWYGRNSPAEHPAVTATELAQIGVHAAVRHEFSWGRVARLLANRDVLLLTLSYICANYVFYFIGDWCFLYLVQERHFQALESGWLAAAPAMVGALGAGIGGCLATALAGRLGVRRGLRLVPLVCLPACALLLLGAVATPNGYLAVAAIALAFACEQVNEGPYWAAIMHCAPADTMAAGGVLNTGGNCGGLIAAPVTAYFSGHGSWGSPFLIGCGFALVAAAGWLIVDPTPRTGTARRNA
ncbi:MAG TPA: MFS transporter [Steroidobacteraceae bacterium]|nr:MFS transporter [Steroidobacteraceae bacterium]